MNEWNYLAGPMEILEAHEAGEVIQMRAICTQEWKGFNGLISFEGDYEYRIRKPQYLRDKEAGE